MSIADNVNALKLFIPKYQGQRVTDPWGWYRGQCVSLVKRWLQFNKWPMRRGNAIQWVNNGYDGYKFYKNTPTFVPTPGDMAIFQTGTYGHIGIVVTATATSMKVFQQNDPVGSPAMIKTYNYITPKCVGVLRKL
jgi:mannosyl-glycoprotein endo-beta-N-acetylglucosaminidase